MQKLAWGKVCSPTSLLTGDCAICRLYKGIQPLWGRQIPYTMMKFACFENTVEALYKYVVPKPKSECSKTEQLTVSFAAGYIAGIFCAVVSQPADNLVSKLNSQPGTTAGGEPNPLPPVFSFFSRL